MKTCAHSLLVLLLLGLGSALLGEAADAGREGQRGGSGGRVGQRGEGQRGNGNGQHRNGQGGGDPPRVNQHGQQPPAVRPEDIQRITAELRRLEANQEATEGEAARREQRTDLRERCNTLVSSLALGVSLFSLCSSLIALAVSAQGLHQTQLNTLASMMSARASTAQAIHAGAMDAGATFAVDPRNDSRYFALGTAAAQTSQFIGQYVDGTPSGCGVPQKNRKAYKKKQCSAVLNQTPPDRIWANTYAPVNSEDQSGKPLPPNAGAGKQGSRKMKMKMP